ncbi:MAG TPA: DUF5009 domain-containing protein [Longimicrobiales bacterium]
MPRLETSEPARPAPGRLASLDAFRGMTIAAMLLVNNPGSWSHIYPPLRHATWHGWTPTDLIFPFFLFIVGVAMTFSFARRLERGASRRELLRKAARRSLVLFGLGLLLHGFPDYDLAAIRIPGVLQRIALASFAASAIVLCVGARGQAAAAAALLLGYWALLSWVPVPGIGAGVLEPGKDLGAWLDRMIFGTEHLWRYSRSWDPEGLLGTLPATASVLLGALAGHWIQSRRAGRASARGLALGGAAAVAVGLAWDTAFPINKNLWTSSYAVFTAGLAALMLAGCHALIDVHGRRRWATPFVVFGTNAIAAFFLSSLAARVLNLVRVGANETPLKAFLHDALFASWLAPVDASLAFAVTYVLAWLGAMSALYRKGIFIKV